MSRDDELRIADILEAAGELTQVVGVGRAQFLREPIRLRAAERLLEIIGEAANALSAETMARFADVDWRSITRLRIVLVHHYQRVDPEQVWIMATIDVPHLADQIGGPY